MRKTTSFILGTLVAILVGAGIVKASTLQGFQGGTGYSTSSAVSDGYCLKQASSSPFLLYTFGPCGSGSASGTVNGTGTVYYMPYWIGTSTLSQTSSIFFDTASTSILTNTNFVTGILNLINGGTLQTTGDGTQLNIRSADGITGNGGTINQVSGSGAASGGNGGTYLLSAGNGGAASGSGGAFYLNGGSSVGGNGSGGNIYLAPGTGNGSGTNGFVYIFPATSSVAAILDPSLITGTNKVFTFPNASGTFCLTSTCLTSAPATTTIALGSGTPINGSAFIFSTSTAGSGWNITGSGNNITWNFPSKIFSLNAISNVTGTLVIGNGDGTFHAMAPGSNGYILVGSSTAPNGLQWIQSPYITAAPATTTINGTQSASFQIIGDNIAVTSTVSGATTTFAIIPSWFTTNFLTSSTVVNTPSTTIPTNYYQKINGSTASGATAYNLYVGGTGLAIATGTGSSTITWTNPGYITTSTNLTTANFATTSISQWVNDSHYVTSTGSSNNATGTVYNGAYFSATNTLVSDTVLHVPTSFTDFGATVNSLYNSVSSTASSVIIMVPNITVQNASWTTPISFSNNGEIPNLICPGGANLKYGGTGTAVTFNFGNPTGHLVSQDYGCTYMGSSTLIAAGQATNATTTGISCGGSNGCVGLDFHDNNINGFGHNFVTGANTYMLNFKHNSNSGGGNNATGSLLYIAPASNSGERFVFDGNSFTDPANSSSNNALYISDSALADAFFTNNSIDDASVYIGISNGLVAFQNNHFENAAYNTYPMKYFITASSSGATTLNVNSNFFALDNTGATGKLSALIEHAVNLTFNDNEVDNYGGASAITNCIDHSINPGQAVEMMNNNWSQNTACSNWAQLTGVTYPAYMIENQNSYPFEITTTGGSLAEFINGQQNVGTVDNNGNWMLLNNVNIGGALNVTSTATFQATTTVKGTLQDASGNKYSTSTSAGGGLASTTPFLIGGLAIASTTNSLSTVPTSTLQISSTQVLIPYLTDGNGTKYTTSTTGSVPAGGNGTSSQIAFWNTSTTLTSDPNFTYSTGTQTYFLQILNGVGGTPLFLVSSTGIAIGTTTFPVGTPLNILGSNSSSTGGTQLNIQNATSNAFSEFVATMDTGTPTTNYVGFGVNNSAYSAGTELAGDLFIEASTTGGIFLQTQTSTIRFCVGGVAASTSAACTKETIGTSTTIFNNNITASGTFTQSGGVASFASTTINGNATATTLAVTSSTIFNGLIYATSTSFDTVGSCGTGPSIKGSMGIGAVTTGSDASSTCTITFSYAYKNKPVCVISSETATFSASTSTIITPAAATLKISMASSTAMKSATIDYACYGK